MLCRGSVPAPSVVHSIGASQALRAVLRDMMLWCLLLPLLIAAPACHPQNPRAAPAVAGPPGVITASVPIPDQDASAAVELLLPPGGEAVRGVLVFVNRGLDEYAFDNREWRAMCARAGCAMLRLTLPRQNGAPPAAQLVRNAVAGGGQALLAALDQLARETAHPELAEAGVIVWGFSAAGSFGPTFAQWRPERTLGFVRYHSNMRGVPVHPAGIADVPALLVAGGADSVAGVQDAEQSWRAARAAGAPWAFAVQPGQLHYSVDGLLQASPLMRGWVAAVLSMRVPDGGSTTAATPRPVALEAGWLANAATGEIARYADVGSAERAAASWLPDEATALDWRAMRGACAALPRDVVARALGESARRTIEGLDVCEYTGGTANGVPEILWLGLMRHDGAAEVRAAFDDLRRRSAGMPPSGAEDRTFTTVDAQRACRTIVARRAAYLLHAVRCGPGYDTEGVRQSLGELADRFVGRR